MHKLMVVFKSSDDSLTLETQWSTEFVARAERMPGLRRVSVSRIVGGPGDSIDLHLAQFRLLQQIEHCEFFFGEPFPGSSALLIV